MRTSRKGIHVIACNSVRLAVLLGRRAHRDRIKPAHERVLVEGVLGGDTAVLVSLTRSHKKVRCSGHGLHATGDDDLVVTRADRLIGERHGDQTRQAELVDRGGRNGHRNASSRCRGARGIGSGTGLHDVAHDHRIDLISRDTRALECTTDGDRAKLNRRQRREDSEQLADGGARAVDDHGSGHGVSSVPNN